MPIDDERFEKLISVAYRLISKVNMPRIFEELYPDLSRCHYKMVEDLIVRDISKQESRWKWKFANRLKYSQKRVGDVKQELKDMKLVRETDDLLFLSPVLRAKLQSMTNDRIGYQKEIAGREKKQHRMGYSDAQAEYDVLVGLEKYTKRRKT